MIIEKELDGTDSFFVRIPMIYSKKTKTYPRVRGWFSFRKENKIHYNRFTSLDDRTYTDNEIDPLNGKEWNEYRGLQRSMGQGPILYFVFDVKQEQHCLIDYICNTQTTPRDSRKRIDVNGLFWQNKIYQGLMKDKMSLRYLNDGQTQRLFDQKFFWDSVMSEYIFSLLKV